MNEAPKKSLKEFNSFKISTEMFATHKAYSAQSKTLAEVVCWYLACYKNFRRTELFFKAVNKLYFDILSLETIEYRHPTDMLYVLSYFIRLVNTPSPLFQQMSQAEKEIEVYKILLISITLADKFLIDDAAYLIETFNCADQNFAKLSFEDIKKCELNSLKALDWNLNLNADENTLTSLLKKLTKLVVWGPKLTLSILENLNDLTSTNAMELFEQIVDDAYDAICTLTKPTTNETKVKEALRQQPAPILIQYQQDRETEQSKPNMKPKF